MNKKEENITNRMRYLVDTLNKAAKVYYQTGEELMPNFEYDKLERELEALEQETGIMLSDSPTIRTGISVDDAEGLTDSRLAKVTHEYPARSLAKTKDELLFPKVFSVRDNMAVLMWKEDGGRLWQLTTTESLSVLQHEAMESLARTSHTMPNTSTACRRRFRLSLILL